MSATITGTDTKDRLLPTKDVLELVPFARPTVDRMCRDGRFRVLGAGVREWMKTGAPQQAA